MTPTLWSLLAAIPAVGLEFLYRLLPGPWWKYLWIWTPASLWISYCICRLVTQPGVPLFGALIVWSFGIITTRVFVTVFLLHDHVPKGTWIALGFFILARVSQLVWTN